MLTARPTNTVDLETYANGGTIQERHLRNINEPLRLLVLSTRHGIGGAITDNAHLAPIRQQLGNVTETHVIGASALGYDNLGIIFHKDCFQARGERTPLDPLKLVDVDRVRSIITDVKPHIILYLDAPEERPLLNDRALMPAELLNLGAKCVIASADASAVSGFWALRSIDVLTEKSSERIDLFPNTNQVNLINNTNVYVESDKLARLFGTKGNPTQRVTAEEKKFAIDELAKLGVKESDKVIYIHAGTSTAIKEFSPAQISELIRRTRNELVKAKTDLSDITFVVSPEPVARPETAAAVMRAITKLGGHAIKAPSGSFGLFRGLIARSDAVICADTAAGHLANALNVPCATLYGNPDPLVPITLWGPSPVQSQIPNSLAVRFHSGTHLAQERFGKLAGHTPQHLRDAEFIVGVIVTAAKEGWGKGLRKT